VRTDAVDQAFLLERSARAKVREARFRSSFFWRVGAQSMGRRPPTLKTDVLLFHAGFSPPARDRGSSR
jgi:hypothetical protein